MKDNSRVLTLLALVLLFAATLWIRPFAFFGHFHASPGVLIFFAFVLYFGVVRRGCCGRDRRRSDSSD